MGLWALGLIESLDSCKYSFFLGAVGPAWHGHIVRLPIHKTLFFSALHRLTWCFILKLENKNNFFEVFLGNYFSRMEEKYKSYLFLLSSFRECQQRMFHSLPNHKRQGC